MLRLKERAIADLGAAILVECWVNKYVFQLSLFKYMLKSTLHLDNRHKSYRISEALGDDFRAKFRQKFAF